MTCKIIKKLNKLPASNLKQKPFHQTSFHQTDQFWIKKAINIWTDVFSFSVLGPDQYYHISIRLDFYSIMNLVFISFVKFLELFPCIKVKYYYTELALEGINLIKF